MLVVSGCLLSLEQSVVLMTWLSWLHLLQHLGLCCMSVGILQYLVVLSLTHLRKTQLIRFGCHKSSCCTDSFLFCGLVLSFSDSATHLGHVLRYDLSDEDYIALRNRDMIQKANCVFMVLTLFHDSPVSVFLSLPTWLSNLESVL